MPLTSNTAIPRSRPAIALRSSRPVPLPAQPIQVAHTLTAAVEAHLADLAATNYAPSTLRSRRACLQHFTRWATERGLTTPRDLTLSILERYQQALYQQVRREAGVHPTMPLAATLSWGTQRIYLIALKGFCRWAVRTHRLAHDPAHGLALPRRPQTLPRTILSVEEVEAVLAQPDCTNPLGLRDRAMLEVLYSTGVRRLELLRLLLTDVDVGRGVVVIHQGKGQKDRVVPIGTRALAWVGEYLRSARPRLTVPPDRGTLFLTRRGRALRPNRLSELVHRYIAAANVGKHGSCHLFRHTMASLLLEGGADIRHIQAMLGHADLATTAIYTRVAINHLKAAHAQAHPAERHLEHGTLSAWAAERQSHIHRGSIAL
jgi:integrase/recombinase XerD